jgi:hypothetical protein
MRTIYLLRQARRRRERRRCGRALRRTRGDALSRSRTASIPRSLSCATGTLRGAPRQQMGGGMGGTPTCTFTFPRTGRRRTSLLSSRTRTSSASRPPRPRTPLSSRRKRTSCRRHLRHQRSTTSRGRSTALRPPSAAHPPQLNSNSSGRSSSTRPFSRPLRRDAIASCPLGPSASRTPQCRISLCKEST